MRRIVTCALMVALGLLGIGAGTTPAALAGTDTTAISFSVSVPFTHTSSCPGSTCLGHGSVMPYGSALAVLDGSGFDFNTWVLTLTTPGGSLVLDVAFDGVDCTTPGSAGDIPRPPTSNDFGNPVTCALSYKAAGGTGKFASARGSLSGTLAFAGTVGTLAGSGQISLG